MVVLLLGRLVADAREMSVHGHDSRGGGESGDSGWSCCIVSVGLGGGHRHGGARWLTPSGEQVVQYRPVQYRWLMLVMVLVHACLGRPRTEHAIGRRRRSGSIARDRCRIGRRPRPPFFISSITSLARLLAKQARKYIEPARFACALLTLHAVPSPQDPIMYPDLYLLRVSLLSKRSCACRTRPLTAPASRPHPAGMSTRQLFTVGWAHPSSFRLCGHPILGNRGLYRILHNAHFVLQALSFSIRPFRSGRRQMYHPARTSITSVVASFVAGMGGLG